MDMGVALTHIGIANLVYKRIEAEPVHAVGVIAAHQDDSLCTNAHIVANMQLVHGPQRGPGFTTVLIPVQVAHHALFKGSGPGTAVIAVCATYVNMRVGNGFVQELDLRPVLLQHASPSGPCRAGSGFAPVTAKWDVSVWAKQPGKYRRLALLTLMAGLV